MKRTLVLTLTTFLTAFAVHAQKIGPRMGYDAFPAAKLQQVSIQLAPNAGVADVATAIMQRNQNIGELGCTLALTQEKHDSKSHHYTFD